MSDYFFPRLQTIVALAPYRLRTTWNTGEVRELDVEERLRRHPALAPILDPAVFARVHVGEWGNSAEWIDEEFGADNLYAWAKEQAGEVSHEMFDEWMRRNGLSLSGALRDRAVAVGFWSTQGLQDPGSATPHDCKGAHRGASDRQTLGGQDERGRCRDSSAPCAVIDSTPD